MKEVRNMHAVAHPEGGAWVVECSEHGPIGVVSDDSVDLFLATHMLDHAEVSA